jgi:aconitate hydratase
VLANACGPCIGQWQRDDIAAGETNTIINSFNRNFPKRNDGNAATLAFVASPDTVVAYALAGTLEFNPLTDAIDGVTLDPPSGEMLPSAGFDPGESGFLAPPATEERLGLEVKVDPGSDRIQLLEPFPAWDGEDFVGLVPIAKATGKCTTDHISMAGPWLKYRGHLENISGNLFLGVVNAWSDEAGTGVDAGDGSTKPLPELARSYRDRQVAWCMIGDENYGEGSSREHAAMEPRFMGCRAVFARSFARIHETNLKKQGVLALTFSSPRTYDEIEAGDRLSVVGLADLAPDQPVQCRIEKPGGDAVPFEATHTMSPDQIEWFRAGSALNIIRQRTTAS